MRDKQSLVDILQTNVTLLYGYLDVNTENDVVLNYSMGLRGSTNQVS